jgi:hypothetical protein
VDEGGRIQEVVRSDVWVSLFRALTRFERDYRGVRAPALFLFAETYWHPKAAKPGKTAELAGWEMKMADIRKANISQIQTELPGAVIRHIPLTTHATILWSEETIGEIRRFLLEGR